MLRPHLDVLPGAQRRLWPELRHTPPEFVLYGGTALALRLGHRQSIDFDFFSSRPFTPSELAARICEQAFDDLDAPVERVAGPDVPMPYAKNLERAAIPHEEDVIAAVKRTMA